MTESSVNSRYVVEVPPLPDVTLVHPDTQVRNE